MTELAIQFQHGGICLPGLGLWLDPHESKPGLVFISHAHADHLSEQREIIVSAPTARLAQARLGGQRIEHVLSFGETRAFGTPEAPFHLTLLPAGHIFGSAMALVEAGGRSLLYTGDFKLRRSLSAEPCEPRHADVLIMETTYGRPEYQFPPADAVLRGVIHFCREALDNDETAVLLGYSLGKSQELLRGLADAGLPIMLHSAVHRLTQIYEQFGQRFPAYEPYEAGRARGKVLICPPSARLNVGPARVAVLTGWAVDLNCRFRYQADAAFPLSDHADFPDLIEMVKQVAPRRVYTLHGFAADFAQTLRSLGFDAVALSEDEQLALPLALRPEASGQKRVATTMANLPQPSSHPSPLAPCPSPFFAVFAETCAAIAVTRSKLEKVNLLANLLRQLDAPGSVATWLTGLPFPSHQNKSLQLGWALLRDALCAVGQLDEAQLRQVYLKHSDLGETAFEIIQDSRPATLSIADVQSFFEQAQAARGPTAKLLLLIGTLQRCTPLEARFLVKIITGDLRIGLKEGLVEEAVARAFNLPAEEVRQTHLLLGDIGQTAELARRNELSAATLTPFRPVKFMLASPEASAAAIWERSRNSDPPASKYSEQAKAQTGRETHAALWVEDKYDGVRCQLHKFGARVALYSRDLKDLTATFREVADAARRLDGDLILDGELLAMQGDQALPFAELQRRLGRREDDLFLRDEIPIRFVAFDLLWRNGQSLIAEPLRTRRAALEALSPWPEPFRLAHLTLAGSPAEIEAAFRAALDRNNEGLLVKDPRSVYSPGRRGLAWLKLKKPLATLDCVVVGAEYGHGKRKNVLSDYTFAVRDETTGELKTIGKAYTGLTDVEIARLTQHFLGRVIRQRGRYHEVEPDTVLEIAFNRIQPSDRHESGLALRFPRIVRVRADKSPADIDTLEAARALVK